MFVNILPLRVDLAGDPAFGEALERVRATVMEALDHQEVPFATLVETLRPPRDPGRTPLYQIGFNQLPIDARGRQLATGTAKTDLTLEVQSPDGGMSGWVEYSTDLFEEETVRRLVSGFLTLLEAALGDPDLPVSRLPLMREEERSLALAAGRGPATPYPERPLHELVAEQAARTPDAPAVVAGGGSGTVTLTYARLEERADALARRLRQRGVRARTPVAVCLPRDPDLIVALLAVLKAGGCYVPLDPEYPAERLGFMLADSGAALLLTRSALVERLPSDHPPAILLDALLSGDLPPLPPEKTSPDALAYVIYTSGSTGRPKGVMVPHRGVVNLVTGLGFTPAERMLLLTSLSFDIAALEIFGPLLAGGTVVLAPPYGTGGLGALVTEAGVTTVQAPPSVLTEIAGHLPAGLPRIFSGGEPLPAHLAGRLREIAGEVWNLYGPTETTIWSTACRVPGRPGPCPSARRWPTPSPSSWTRRWSRSHRGGGRAVPGRRRRGPRLPRPSRPHRRTLRRRPLRARRPALPDRRPGTADARRRAGVPGPRRRPGQGAGRTDRAGRGGGGAGGPSGRAPGGRGGAGRRPGGRALVAYLDTGGAVIPAGELRAFLQNRLPATMLPSLYVPVGDFPGSPTASSTAPPCPPRTRAARRPRRPDRPPRARSWCTRSGARSWAGPIWGSTTTSSTSAATRCSAPRSSPGSVPRSGSTCR
nr:hypothetical protein GCM10020093_013270 [Planobispora longispora]